MYQNVNNPNNSYYNLIEFRKLGCIYEYLKLTEDIIKYNNIFCRFYIKSSVFKGDKF